ncbi:MAG: ABC transporter ATP-binding protein [Anaerolineaceae bacterium]|jgi:ABC-2 type transport system ATP-binding protein
MENNFSVHTENLGRIYKIRDAKKGDPKTLTALSDVNISIKAGELFGLLGPNGAGKTTLIKILTTLLSPTDGIARVAGYDVHKEPDQVRTRINMVSGGESSGYGLLTVRENLWMFAQFYGIPTKEANARISKLLDIVGLADRANMRSADLSTGLRQKMNIVRGFLTDPEILFLDEPTLGLDVSASRDVHDFIRTWMNDNPVRTLLLTTHYMAEADELCDRVAIINKGKVLACDTPEHLKKDLQHDAIFSIDVECNHPIELEKFHTIAGLNNIRIHAENGTKNIEVFLKADEAIAGVITQFTEQEARIISLQKRQPTLEDVFVDLVGKRMEEVEDADAPASE